ncbi:hypothetical protein DINM_022805 [Dirofilaria immitis]|nr:hypothetical protein [Dirofilaria immitis]
MAITTKASHADVYNKHGRILMRKFQALCGDQYNDIFHMISLCTLDVICEAALGIDVDAQNKSSPYLDAAIANRKRLIDEAGGVDKLMEKETISGKRRIAFLDFMLDLHAKSELPMEGVQEEVDTFTFEAHDTTSTNMNWFLHLMGTHPEIQAKIQKEIDEVLGEDIPITYEDIGQLKFLEACIKETLRLFPSVPMQARQLTKATKIGNRILPSGTGVVIIASMVHRDVRYWPDPEIFKPERFIGNQSRHPFSYIPFSAGSRNCIGQRFALMEEKCILALLMRNLKVKSKLRTDQMRVSAELVIRPLYGNNIRFEPRKFGDYVQIT